VERIVMSLLDAGGTDAASDIMTESERLSASGLAPLALPPGLPPCPADEFMGMLPGIIRSREPFAGGAEGAGKVWRRFLAAFPQRRISRSVELAALERLLGWLGLGTGMRFEAEQVLTAGAPRPRVFATGASGDPPLPVWGAGRPTGTSVLVSEGGESRSVRGFLEELDAWHPGPGMIPLAVSLSRLTVVGKLYDVACIKQAKLANMRYSYMLLFPINARQRRCDLSSYA
jgi:hypothetical protein